MLPQRLCLKEAAAAAAAGEYNGNCQSCNPPRACRRARPRPAARAGGKTPLSPSLVRWFGWQPSSIPCGTFTASAIR